MNVVFITEINCFPPNNGEKLRSFNLIKSLLEFVDHLHLVSGSRPPDKVMDNNFTYYPFPPDYRRKNRWKDQIYLFRRDKKLEAIINNIIINNKIDIAFLDYKFLGNYIDLFHRNKIKVIYGTHNIQFVLNAQSPAHNLKDRIFKRYMVLLQMLHEKFFFPKSNALITVSEVDRNHYRKTLSTEKVYTIPNYIDEQIYSSNEGIAKKNQVIMAANFFAFQNSYGLKWFVENVWDEELAGLTQIILAGHRSKEELQKLQHTGALTLNITAVGSVDDMKPYIAQSKVAIIPLLHGSGTRLKCIEAMALKTTIVSTSIGAEGIEHNGSIMIADSPAEFKAKLKIALTQNTSSEDKAYNVFLNYYSARANTQKLEKLLKQTIAT